MQIFLFLDSKICLKIYKFDGGVGEIVYVFITHLYFHLSNSLLQYGLYLIRRPSHVLDRFVSTYDQYRIGRPSLSTYAQVKYWMLFDYFYYGIFLSYKTKVSRYLRLFRFFVSIYNFWEDR